MTTYRVNGRTMPLVRSSVLSERDWFARAAVSYAGRAPTSCESEMGLDRSDLRILAAAYGREAQRLTRVLEAIDAGAEELPRELYPHADVTVELTPEQINPLLAAAKGEVGECHG